MVDAAHALCDMAAEFGLVVNWEALRQHSEAAVVIQFIMLAATAAHARDVQNLHQPAVAELLDEAAATAGASPEQQLVGAALASSTVAQYNARLNAIAHARLLIDTLTGLGVLQRPA